MATSVQVSNVGALIDLRRGMERFADSTAEILLRLEVEIRRTLEEWERRVEESRREVRNCADDLESARRDLRWCESSGDDDGSPDCSYEYERVLEAKRALEDATSRLELRQRCAANIEDACEQFKRHGRALHRLTTQTGPDGVQHLGTLVADLERYLSISPGEPEVATSGVSTAIPFLDALFNLRDTPLDLTPQYENAERLAAYRHCLFDPIDGEQVQRACEALHNIPILQLQNWANIPESELFEALRTVENVMADIQGRPPVPVHFIDDAPEYMGGYDLQKNTITINRRNISKTDPRATMDTIVHEGRHAYQKYATEHPNFHPIEGQVEDWRYNNLKYFDVEKFGYIAYRYQPLERDAYDYADEVTNKFYGNRS